MKVFALTFGGPDAASTHYRVLQYRPWLNADGIQLDWTPLRAFSSFERLADCDCVVLQKSLPPRRLFDKIRKYSRRLVYDLDDAIWHRPEKDYRWWTRHKQLRRLGHVVRNSDRSLCANQVICDQLTGLGAGDACIVPMAIDAGQWFADCNTPEINSGPLTIGWSGSPKNVTYLGRHLLAWLKIQQRYPHVRWVIHSGRKPMLDGLCFDHVPYVPGEEPGVVRSFDIGLLPMPPDPFSQAKSPIKALQYLATGTAIAAMPAAATRELLPLPGLVQWAQSTDEWVQALAAFIDHPELLRRAKRTGLDYFLQHHRTETVYQQWRRALLGQVEDNG